MNRLTKDFFSFKAMAFRNNISLALVLLFCFFLSGRGQAGILFKEVTGDAAIKHSGTSYGASWGDLNGDGWPDLWVGNHNSKPTLYLNKQDGTFENIIDQIWSGDHTADTHGAAWADFDNDGDQDLVELVDVRENSDGTFSTGRGRNHLFVNDKGKLRERAGEYHLDHEGNARSPLWFDADRDGLLDLLVVNMPRTGMPSSTVFMQKNNQFVVANERLEFKDAKFEKTEKIKGRIQKLLKLSYPSVPYFRARRFLESAQLGDLSSNGFADLILFSNPTKIYRINTSPFDDITLSIGLPDLSRISDVAIADFDGNQRMDMYVAKGLYMPSDIIRTSAIEIKGRINNLRGGSPKAVHLQAEGTIQFQIYPTWVPLSNVYIGSNGRHPASRSFSLSPQDSNILDPAVSIAAGSDGISITYDVDLKTWKIINFNKKSHIDFIATATKAISEYKTVGFNLFKEEGVDSLLLQQKGGFVQQELVGKAGEHTSCYSIVAGDFDNDMDVDLYLTCTGPVANIKNRLLENNGKGDFRLVSDAGGAMGSELGRGDVVVSADYDRDGFLDLFVTNGHDPTSPFTEDGPHQLFRNQGNSNHWLEIDLQGVVSNRDGIGSRIELKVNNFTQVREQNGGMHRIAQNHQRLHFGLGKHSHVDEIIIKWPSGIVQRMNNVEANQILHVTEPVRTVQ